MRRSNQAGGDNFQLEYLLSHKKERRGAFQGANSAVLSLLSLA